MRRLKDVNTEMYELIKDRTSFLTSDEEYIVDNLKSPITQDNEISLSYDKATVFKIVKESCDWIDTTDTENALWCAWYSSWYEEALKELSLYLEEWTTIQDLILKLDYLLKN